MVEKIPPSLDKTAPRLILIVDDEARMRRFIRMNMELEGYQAIEAENGLQALEQIRKYAPDLVIMDIMMPELDASCAKSPPSPSSCSPSKATKKTKSKDLAWAQTTTSPNHLALAN